jgi:hypothetical protein
MSSQNKKTNTAFSPEARRKFKRWLSALWNNLEWPFVGILAIGSLLLGAKGYADYYLTGDTWLTWDTIYLSLQLFVLQSSAFEIGSKIPEALQVARFLSPAIGAYALFQAFIEIFDNQLHLLRLFITRNHTIICGLGQKGLLLVRDQLKANQYVVVIERDSNNPGIDICRELGALVLIGDARDGMMLRKAGVRRAKYLFVVCGEDGTNVEAAEQAQILVEGRRRNTLTCVLHISDAYLWTLLRERMFFKEQSSSFRTELFNVYDTGARVLLQETIENVTGQPPHILVIGMGELAVHLILRLAQKWCIDGNQDKLLISIIDPYAERELENLKAHFPLVEKTCKFYPHNFHTNYPEFQTGKFLEFSEESAPISHAYICFDDTALGIQAGFVLLRLLQDQKAQIMVRMTEDAGLATFLKEIRNTSFENLSAFGLLDRTCGMGLFDDGTHEGLARTIHEDFLGREIQKGMTIKDNPNLVSWESLSENIKESNRRQADHIGIKLATIGCGMEPWREFGREDFKFDPEEILKMARMEHERWCNDRLRDGWKYGRERNDARKIHPDLIVWDRLTSEAKEKDIAAARLIPNLLARAGFQIYRIAK